MATLHESITPERIQELAEQQMFEGTNIGVCKACGEEQDGCEPDARNYECHGCGERQVFGAEELMIEIL